MKLIARVALLPDSDQHRQLLEVLERVNTACNFISREAWAARTFGRFALHKLVYRTVREQFGLSAQLTVHAIGKVADAYKLDKKCQRTFKRRGAIVYDYQIVSYRLQDMTVSLQVLNERIRIPFTCGERARTLLATQQGQSDLLYREGKFFLFAPCNVEEPTPEDNGEFLGVDLGITNIAVDSDGTMHAANHLKQVRCRHRRLRAKLQRKGTKSATRRLKHLAGKERRFATNTNHLISKQLVAVAKGTKRGIALENLTHIRSRVTVRNGRQRITLHSWAFDQLRQHITYKARCAGVRVVTVDPRNTSRTCPACGCIDKANRKTQAIFLCIACGFAGNADVIAAGVIASRAALNLPNAGGMHQRTDPPTCKPSPLGDGR